MQTLSRCRRRWQYQVQHIRHLVSSSLTNHFPSQGLILLDNTINDCQDDSKGQVYARAYYEKTELKGQLAIMYAWYIPKETYNPEAGKLEPGQPVDLTQHKHAWHWIVVYLSSNQADATLTHVKYQNAGKPTVLVTPSLSGDGSSDKDKARTHPNVVYKQATSNSHEVCESKEPGEQQKLLAWERFTDKAKTAISTSDFGGIMAPFGDYNTFKSTVVKS